MFDPAQHLQVENEKWLQERHRYEVLEHIHARTGGDCAVSLVCRSLADDLGFTREEMFRILHDLEYRGYLSYVGSGPRVRLTPRAVAYIELGAGRRHSIRD